MSQIQYIDELIREYLLYRCFSNTLKVFDSELKSDKDKGFRDDKIVDQLMQHIYSYDLSSLKELWSHLDQKMFTKLENSFTAAVKKLEGSVLKLYIVNCVVNGKQDKINEFFAKMTPELQWQSEWKEWFVLPFLKNPEENATFAVHFTRQWQDTLLVSLHNFLATIFQCMPQPTLSAFEDDAARMKQLQEENDALKQRINTLLENPRGAVTDNVIAPDLSQPAELMDDFYIIAQGTGGETSSKSYKTFIRSSIGLPSSPNTHRRSTQAKTRSVEEPHRRSSSKHRTSSTSGWPKATSTETKRDASRTREPSIEREATARRELPIPTTNIADKAFLMLGQEEYSEHRCAVSCLKFNGSGSAVVSADADGVIKMWATTPTPKTIATFTSKSSVLSLDWVSKNERYLVTGGKSGSVRLFDTRDNKPVWELPAEPNTPLHNAAVVHVCCNPVESSFVCSAVSQGTGKLLLYDLKTRQLERTLSLGGGGGGGGECHAACSAFNHNGQLLVVGCSDGATRLYDLRSEDSIDTSRVHRGAVLSIQLTADDTSCCTLGQDGKLCRRSLNQSGLGNSWEASLAEGAGWRTVTPPHGQLFSFDPAGSHVLVCGPLGGSIHQVTSSGLNHMLDLGGHQCPTVAADWSISNQCATCVTASGDGKIRVSTLLTP